MTPRSINKKPSTIRGEAHEPTRSSERRDPEIHQQETLHDSRGSPDTNPASTTDPPTPPNHHCHTAATTYAPSDEPPHTGGPHPSPTPRPTPPTPPIPLLHHTQLHQHHRPLLATGHVPANKKDGTEGVIHVPEPLSPSNRNRVHKAEPTYRSHTVQYLPKEHTHAAIESRPERVLAKSSTCLR